MTIKLAEMPWLRNYDPQVPQTIDYPNQPLQRFLEDAARKFPTHTALIFKGRAITYRKLNQLCDAVAAGLHASGFQAGDRAVVYMPNSPQFIIAYYGILKAGGVVVATNPLYTERELEHQLHDCGAETVFVLSLYYNLLKRVQATGHTNVKRVIVSNIKEYLPAHLRILFTLAKEEKEGHRVTLQAGDVAFQDFLQLGLKAPRPQVTVTGDDIALLQYTGGTTGLSKGAIGLHRNMVANIYQMRAWLPDWKEQGEVILTAIPLFHSYGMVTALHLGMSMAATLVLIANPRDQKDLLQNINKYQPSMFPGVPAMYVAINNNPDVVAGKYKLGSIRACLSGSAPLLMETKQRFEELTGGTLVEGYGLTEAHVATHANPIRGRNVAGSIGMPLPGVACRVVDVNDPTRDLDIGEVGELVLRSPTIMPGYWNMPEATDRTVQDGWLFTGDVVECDEDGYFYIRDRKKDMIIAGGYNIYPREVEEVLSQHPDVIEVAVGGVPDERRGETVKAWVVKRPGSTLTEQALIDWSKDKLAKYKYPRHIEFRAELPKTTVGKILKRDLVKEHMQAPTQMPVV